MTRIQKILSARGVASRREAERLILAGRVTVNGKMAVIGQSAEPGRDNIAIDGVLIANEEEPVYIMLNKPKGFITTASDDRGRKTVMDLVTDVGTRVYPIGRLDMNTEGLLLMTNDGQFANAVMHPSYNKSKTYEVHVRGDVENVENILGRPIMVDTRLVQAASVWLIEQTRNGGVLQITIYEGRNRQIRKMCAQCALEVLSLKRLSIGSLELGSLKSGKWRHLTNEERLALFDSTVESK